VLTRERRPGITILVYHRVGGGTEAQLDLPVQLFEWHLSYLKTHHRVIGLDRVVEMADGRTAPGHDTVAITFDDGYEDVYRHAFPLLLRYALPATVYLTTRPVEDRRPLPVPAVRRDQWGAPLTWKQAEEMVTSGLITVGAHTHTHPDLGALTESEVDREITESNRLIAGRLGQTPRHFAYPWGHSSGAARRVVERTYRTAAVGGSRKNPYAGLDLTSLLRVPVQRSDGRWFFRLKLASCLPGEEWMRALGDLRRRLKRRHPAGAAVSS